MLEYDKTWPQYDLKNNKVRPVRASPSIIIISSSSSSSSAG